MLCEFKSPLEVIKQDLNKSCEVSLKSSLETLPWFDKDLSRGCVNDALIELNKDCYDSNDHQNIMILENLSIADDLDRINLSMIKTHPNSIAVKAVEIPQKELSSCYINDFMAEDNLSPNNYDLVYSKKSSEHRGNENFIEYDSDSINKEINTDFISSSDFKEGFFEPNTNIKLLKLLPATSPIKSKNDCGITARQIDRDKCIEITPNCNGCCDQHSLPCSIKPILKLKNRKLSDPQDSSLNNPLSCRNIGNPRHLTNDSIGITVHSRNIKADIALMPYSDTRKQCKTSGIEMLNTFHPKLKNRLIETKDKILTQNKVLNTEGEICENTNKIQTLEKEEKSSIVPTIRPKPQMNDFEIEKLEKLLNCKNKAVKKWIEEKEHHFDKLTQKLFEKGKRMARHFSMHNKNLGNNNILDQISESNPSSIRITESENEDESIKTNLSESRTIEHSLIEHMKREFGNDATSDMFYENGDISNKNDLSLSSEKMYNIKLEIQPSDIKSQPYITETKVVQKVLPKRRNSKVVDYTEKHNANTVPSHHDGSNMTSSIEENIYPNVNSGCVQQNTNLTSRSSNCKDAFSQKKKSASIHIKLLKGLREKEAIINSKRSRAYSKSNNLIQAKTLSKNLKKQEAVLKKTNKSIEIEKESQTLNYKGCQKYSNKEELSSKEIDALFFLIDEYERECKIHPKIKHISLIDFWKMEYSKEALLIKIKNEQINPQLVSEILEDKCISNSNPKNSYDIEMMRILSRMNEQVIEQLYSK